jgi:glucokinase
MLKTTNVEYRIGIDVGGTKMSAVILAGEKVVGEYILATPTDDLNKFMVMLGALVEPLFEQAKKAKAKIASIGIGVPGAIDNGKILASPNVPCLKGVKIVELLTEKFGSEYRVVVDNDANCFTLGEARFGAGTKHNNVFGIIVGTGIGSGIYKNDSLYEGSHELGAMVLDYREQLTLENSYHRLTQNNPRLLAEEAYQGDELANKLFGDFGQILGVAIANVINLLDPDIVVIGGGATQSSDLFLHEINKTATGLVVVQEKKNIKIVISKLGKQAGAIGAALL